MSHAELLVEARRLHGSSNYFTGLTKIIENIQLVLSKTFASNDFLLNKLLKKKLLWFLVTIKFDGFSLNTVVFRFKEVFGNSKNLP